MMAKNVRDHGFFLRFSLLAAICLLTACNLREQSPGAAAGHQVLADSVITHFQATTNDSLRLKAAVFLLENIRLNYFLESPWVERYDRVFASSAGKSQEELVQLKDSLLSGTGESDLQKRSDSERIRSSELIAHIDFAVDTWQRAPWKDSIPFELFARYILPYKVFQEFPELDRLRLRRTTDSILLSSGAANDPVAACTAINKWLGKWFRFTLAMEDYPGRIRLSYLEQGRQGNCADMAALAVHYLRAGGLAVAVDYTPQWSNARSGHVWNALILSPGRFMPFMGTEGDPVSYKNVVRESESRPAKIFRRIPDVNKETLVETARLEGLEADQLPVYLQSNRILDVTAAYVPVTNVEVRPSVGLPRNTSFVYLCIFDNDNWQAIGWAPVSGDGNRILFKDMGRDIAYLPMIMRNGRLVPVGAPLLVRQDGSIRQLLPGGQRQRMTLTRKYPLKREAYYYGIASALIGSRIEGSLYPDFREPVVLHETKTLQADSLRYRSIIRNQRDIMSFDSIWERVAVPSKVPAVRYVRLVAAPGQPLLVGELELYGKDGTDPLTGRPFGTADHPENAFDGGAPGASVSDNSGSALKWVGLDLNTPRKLAYCRFLPAGDSNMVQPGLRYKLFYWDNGWRVAAEKKAAGFSVSFDDVPAGTLYWLHCMDGGQEERIFTFENGRPHWW